MSHRSLLVLALVLSGPAAAQTPSAHPARKAARSAAPKLNPAVPPTDDAVTAPGATGRFTLDTPIEQIIADPGARAVLDRDLPGLSDDENLPKFKAMSLHQFQPLTGGQLTPALLAKAEADLAALGGEPGPVTPPSPAPTSTER